MQMGLMWRMLKDWEGRGKKISRKWVVFASCRVDKKIEDWVTDKTISSGHIYCVAYVKEIVPGRERSYDWMLDVYPLEIAIPVAAIGFGHVTPTPAHAPAMLALNAQLASLQMTSTVPVSKVWSHTTDPVPMSVEGGRMLPLSAVHMYKNRCHTSWDGAMKTGDIVWYSPIKRGYASGEMIQARIVAHLSVLIEPVFIFICCLAIFF
jgi:hypothetical protein